MIEQGTVGAGDSAVEVTLDPGELEGINPVMLQHKYADAAAAEAAANAPEDLSGFVAEVTAYL